MASIAEAYRAVGNDLRFNEAMEMLKAPLDVQQSEGADNWPLSLSLARQAMLTDDHAAAIGFLERAFQQGAYFDTEIENAFPMFKPLDGDPRYEAAKAAMNLRFEQELENMNQDI